jgi:ribonuclease BN (tRNA processing enzyme)
MRRSACAKNIRLAGLLLAGLAVGVAASAQQSTSPAAPSASAAPPLELVVLGSGGPGATGRAGSSYLVLIDGEPRILVDAGPGSFVRLGEAKLSLAKVDIVLLTHLHVDHAGELPGLFKARAVSSRGPIAFRVFGPDGRHGGGDNASFPATSRFLDLMFGEQGAFGYLRNFSAPMTIKVSDVAATIRPADLPHKILTEGNLTISTIAGHHRDAPAVIYRIDYFGKSITFSGDIDGEGLPGLRKIALATDLLVFNSVVLDPPGSPAVLYSLHTPPKAIGEIAHDSHVKRLVLSHLSPSVEQAREAVTLSVARNYSGPVVFAQDGMRLEP